MCASGDGEAVQNKTAEIQLKATNFPAFKNLHLDGLSFKIVTTVCDKEMV